MKYNIGNKINPKVITYLKALVKANAIKLGDFTLRNGKKSCIYIDHGDLICNPDTNKAFIKAILEYIQSNFSKKSTVLINVDSKSSPQITGALANAGEYRQIVLLPKDVYVAEKGTNRMIRFPMNINRTDKFIIVDDVLTSGQTVIDVAQKVKSFLIKNYRINNPQFYVIVGLARNPKIVMKKLAKVNIKSYWLIDLETILSYIWHTLSAKQKTLVQLEFKSFNQK